MRRAIFGLVFLACTRPSAGPPPPSSTSDAPIEATASPTPIPSPSPTPIPSASPSASPTPTPTPTPVVSLPLPTPLPPLHASSWLEELPDSLGFVSPPAGASDLRPVVVGVHGALDRPDWACSEWRAIFGPRPFIVCPGGAPAQGAFVWRSADALMSAISRALDAVSAKYGPYIAEGPRVYAGFSQGAVLGAAVVQAAPQTYPYAVFLEGLGDVSTRRFTRKFHDDGGKRVMLACSQAGCEATRRSSLAALEAAGIDAKIVYAGPIGHTVNGKVIDTVKTQLPWLLAGDTRF